MPPSDHRTTELLGPFEYRFPATAKGARLARQVLGLWLDEQPIPHESRYDLLLACSELCGNAIRHGASGTEGCVALAARVEGDGVLLEVHDDGRGFTLHGRARAGGDAEGGRGLQLVEELTDHIEVRVGSDHTVVRCYKAEVIDLSAQAQRDGARQQPPLRRQA